MLLLFLKIVSAISSTRDATIVEHYPNLYKKNTFPCTKNACIYLNPVVAVACTTNAIIGPSYPGLLNQAVLVSAMKDAGIILP